VKIGVAIAVIVVLVILAFVGGFFAYKQGDAAGYQTGYAKGTQDGEKAGYTSGYNDGEAKGNAEGQKAGYDEGYNKGQQDAHLSYASGEQEGEQEGYTKGYNQGWYSGWTYGWRDGWWAGCTNCWQQCGPLVTAGDTEQHSSGPSEAWMPSTPTPPPPQK
jgi:flagellar biosynthesis/type III secretory pathway protein FliH